MTDREVMRQALDVLEDLHEHHPSKCDEPINALRAALAQQAEPVVEPAIPWGKTIGAEQKRGCRVCGIGADGRVVGYVCSRGDCPTKMTCGG